MLRLSTILFIVCLLSAAFSGAQTPVVVDTTDIDLTSAENLFIKNNYLLLAQKYNVDAGKALIRQAKAFNNPTIYIEQGVYNPNGNPAYFDVSKKGESIVQVQQLISIAGKRNKQVAIAKLQADIAQYQFDDLIRTLLLQLRSDFYELHYSLESLRLFDEEILSLKSTLDAFEIQYAKGNISLREVVRIRALMFSLQNDRFGLFSVIQEKQKELGILLSSGKPVFYRPKPDTSISNRYNLSKISLSELMTQALENRPDLKMAKASVDVSQAQLRLQKAQAVPDLNIGAVYDKNGNYIPNYNAISLGFPLPVFNQNRGNINAAKLNLSSSEVMLQQKQAEVQNDVILTYMKILQTEKIHSSVNSSFTRDFIQLMDGVQNNFDKKNISLLEFTDLFETYKESIIQYNKIQNQRIGAYEELNFAVGKDLFKP